MRGTCGGFFVFPFFDAGMVFIHYSIPDLAFFFFLGLFFFAAARSRPYGFPPPLFNSFYYPLLGRGLF